MSIQDGLAALVAAKQQIGKISTTERANVQKFQFNYLPLSDLLEIVEPVMLEHGLLISQDVGAPQPGFVSCRTSIYHVSCDDPIWESGPLVLEVSAGDNKQVGIAITYLRRYQLLALLSIAPGNDDAPSSSSGQRGYSSPPPRPASSGPVVMGGQHGVAVNNTNAPCPECFAPPGKPHATGCAAVGGPPPPTVRPTQQSQVDEEDFYPQEFLTEMYTTFASLVHNERIRLPSAVFDAITTATADDKTSQRQMSAVVAPGKKMSQYGLLCSKIDQLIPDEYQQAGVDHKAVLSALFQRPVSKANPPGMEAKWVIDRLMEGDEETQFLIKELALACHKLQTE